jgi:hypothetical protein
MGKPRKEPILFTKGPEPGAIRVTKLDAAIRQLETAVTLWFNDGDPVSICTLTYAGHTVLMALNKKFKAKTAFDQTGGVYDPKNDEMIRMLFSGEPNWFKHYTTHKPDPDLAIYFNPVAHLLLLMNAILTYNQWGLSERPIFSVFQLWLGFGAQNDASGVIAKQLPENQTVDLINSPAKKTFFDKVLPIIVFNIAKEKTAASAGH